MIQRIVIIILAVAIVLLAWFYLVPYLRLMVSPFSWSEADIDKNGFVTSTEADYYANYGTRQYTENDKNCIEYYSLKDGLTLKKTCK